MVKYTPVLLSCIVLMAAPAPAATESWFRKRRATDAPATEAPTDTPSLVPSSYDQIPTPEPSTPVDQYIVLSDSIIEEPMPTDQDVSIEEPLPADGDTTIPADGYSDYGRRLSSFRKRQTDAKVTDSPTTDDEVDAEVDAPCSDDQIPTPEPSTPCNDDDAVLSDSFIAEEPAHEEPVDTQLSPTDDVQGDFEIPALGDSEPCSEDNIPTPEPSTPCTGRRLSSFRKRKTDAPVTDSPTADAEVDAPCSDDQIPTPEPSTPCNDADAVLSDSFIPEEPLDGHMSTIDAPKDPSDAAAPCSGDEVPTPEPSTPCNDEDAVLSDSLVEQTAEIPDQTTHADASYTKDGDNAPEAPCNN